MMVVSPTNTVEMRKRELFFGKDPVSTRKPTKKSYAGIRREHTSSNSFSECVTSAGSARWCSQGYLYMLNKNLSKTVKFIRM